MSEFVWGTVASVAPVRVRLDGDTAPIPLDIESLIDPLTLGVGDRVRVERADKRLLIHGRSGGDALAAYPVGSIYLTAAPDDPADLLGGTWVPWGAGRVPVGVDPAQIEFASVEDIGGEKAHTLTVAESAPHTHDFLLPNGGGSPSLVGGSGGNGVPVNVANGFAAVASSGGGNPHNNLQPYITCFMWKRTG